MTSIFALCGSLRENSSNRAILEAARSLAAPFCEVRLGESLALLPYFNPDLEREALPEAVRDFRARIAAADAILISTPEYAHGIPGVLKNALDWLVADPDFAGKRVGLIYGSATGASFAHESLAEILKTMSAEVIPAAVLGIPGARMKIRADGTVSDSATADRLRACIWALVAP